MADATEWLLTSFDGHDVDGIRAALAAGADPRTPVRGKPPIEWLLGEYTRSDRFPDCLLMLLENGAAITDPFLAPVLLNDAGAIRTSAASAPEMLAHRVTLGSAFTSLYDSTLLHVAAEYGNLAAAEALVELGADVNASAGIDELGIGGHPPIFHTVNSNGNRSEPIMRLLIDAGANCSKTVAAVDWGKGYPWETIFFDVTPVSYAQLGLLPQMHREETDVYSNVRQLLSACGRALPEFTNVPNRYLMPNNK